MKYRNCVLLAVRTLALVLFAAFCVSEQCKAGVLTERIAGVDNAQPYTAKIAEKSEDLNDPIVKSEVGLYVQTKEGELQQIVAGQILPHRISGPILGRFHVTSTDGRHAMLAVVNHKLRIFSINTRLDDPKSSIELGSKLWPLIDSATGQTVKVPLLKSAEHVSIFFGEETSEGQTFIVSIKLPRAGLQGNGITFAGFLEAGQSSSDPVLKLGSKAYVLSYQYYDTRSLEGFIAGTEDSDLVSDSVVSPLFAQALSLGTESDHQVVKQWREQLKKRVKTLNQDLTGETRVFLPRINLKTGARSLGEVPTGREQISDSTFVQTYDVISAKSELKISVDEREFTLPGRLNVTKGGDGERYSIFSGWGDSQIVLFVLEGNLHAVIQTDHSGAYSTQIIRLAMADEEVFEKVNFSGRWMDGGKLVLFVTGKNVEGESSTRAFEIALGKGNHRGQVTRVLHINREFYENATEFSNRITATNRAEILFDDKAPYFGGSAEYANHIRKNQGTPKLSFVHSTDERKVYLYPNTDTETFRFDLAEGAVGVRVSDAPLNSNRTDLFFGEFDELSTHVVELADESEQSTAKKGKKYLIFTSGREKGKASTFVTPVVVSGSNISKGSVLTLSQSFYSKEELQRRVVLGDDDRYVFDDVTPPQLNVSSYNNLYESSGVHIDILASHGNNLVRRLRQPIREVPIATGVSFREYGYDGRVTAPSGVYYKSQKGKQIESGQLLSRLPADGERKYIFHNAELFLPRRNGKEGETDRFFVSGLLVDPLFNEGKDKVIYHLIVMDENGNEVVREKMTFGVGLDRLDAITLKAGKKEYSNRFFVVYSYKTSKGNDRESQSKGTSVRIGFQLHRDISVPKNITYKMTADSESVLFPGLLNQQALESRIVFEGASGEPSFELTPELDHSDANYEVIGFVGKKAWKPNVSDDPNVKIERDKMAEAYRKGQLWRIHSKNSSRSELEAVKKDIVEFRQDVLPKITEILTSVSAPNAPARHIFLTVDKTLKPFVFNLLLGRYVDDSEKSLPRRWNYTNQSLPLYLLNSKDMKDQATFLENLESIRETRGRPVIIADVQSFIKDEAIPSAGSGGYQYKDFKSRSKNTDDTDHIMQEELRTPSAFYLMRTEGQKIDPRKFVKRSSDELRISQIFVGTKEEIASLRSKTYEQQFGILEAVEVVDLGDPSPEMRKDILRQALRLPEIDSLGLSYDASQLTRSNPRKFSEEEQLELLLNYMVNRAERFATQEGRDVFQSLMRVKTHLVNSLVDDEWIKKSRTLDLPYIDRLFTGIFKSMPWSLKILPDGDILRKLSHPNAIAEWQKAGYAGDPQLKRIVIEAILDQLYKNTTIKVPASFLIIGRSRSGKTYLFETLVRMLGLKWYDYHASPEDNEDAQVIKVRLSDGSFDDQIKHVEHLLTLRNGSRAFILFDDIHLYPPATRLELTTWIRNHTEQDYYTAESFDRRVVERPTSNLVIFATLNPPEDISRIREFDPEWSPWSGRNPNPLSLAKAALHDKNATVDESFFNRINKFLVIDKFPIGAKGPELINNLVQLSRVRLENNGTIFFSSPQVVSDLVRRFPDENAKDFVSQISSAMVKLVGKFDYGDPTPSILTTSPQDKVAPAVVESIYNPNRSSEAAKIPGYVDRNITVVPVDEGYRGRFELLKLMIDSFRVRTYEELVQELSQSDRYALDHKVATSLLAPTLYGLGRHLLDRAVLPLREVGLDSFVMGAKTKSDQIEFEKELRESTASEPTGHFPEDFDRISKIEGLISLIERGGHGSNDSVAHQDLFRRYIDRVYSDVFHVFTAALELQSTQPFPEPREWLAKLNVSKQNPFKQLAKKLTATYEVFRQDVLDPRLYRDIPAHHILDFYDTARLFAFVIDKAIAKLPWARTGNFMVQALEVLGQDINLAQMRGVQDFFFDRSISIMKPTTRDLALESILSSPIVQNIGEGREAQMNQRFQDVCKAILKAEKK